MSESKHTRQELAELQALPLSLKVRLTKQRIREWVNHYGVDGVAVSFSGGKDSTVLLHIVREMYGDSIPGVFCDTGLEYPEIRAFVRTFDNIVWLKPKMNFREVIDCYGYPFISKEVSKRVYSAKKYLQWYEESRQSLTDRQTDRQTVPAVWGLIEIIAGRRYRGTSLVKTLKKGIIPSELLDELFAMHSDAPANGKMLFGTLEHKENGVPTGETSKMYDFSKWRFTIKAPFMISDRCCYVIKKSPLKQYKKETGRVQITAQMACESKLRTTNWLLNGCNLFDAKDPISNPMSFWTEQDVLLYIYQNKIPIASVYGEVVKEVEVEGQLDFEDLGIFELERPVLRTTGCNRTGCMFCGYGCHLEPPGEGRFERLKVTHPKIYDYIMRPWEQGGLNYKEVIDWLNENGNLNIRY